MYTIKVITDFSGAHNLRGYKGKCEDLHGHNWKIEVEVRSSRLNDLGMVADFTEIKRTVKDFTGGIDHKYLNDIDFFKEYNPTSENIAKYIFEGISKKRPELDVVRVTVWETDTSSATYSASG